jgi:hypothetical protein
MILLEFQSGATGSLYVSAVAHEPSPFGQLHQMELHGSEGTLHAVCDWNRVQRVDGCRAGEPAIHELPIPDRIFDGARRDVVTDTYKNTFRDHDVMARGFVTAIATGTPASPEFRDGLAVQRVVDAASRSARGGTPRDDRGDRRRRGVKRAGDNNREARSPLGGPGGARGGRRRGDADPHGFERIPWRARARDLGTGAPEGGSVPQWAPIDESRP